MSRLATVPLIIQFGVAVYMIHGGDAFPVREKAFLYLLSYVLLLLTGPGRFSIDQRLRRR